MPKIKSPEKPVPPGWFLTPHGTLSSKDPAVERAKDAAEWADLYRELEIEESESITDSSSATVAVDAIAVVTRSESDSAAPSAEPSATSEDSTRLILERHGAKPDVTMAEYVVPEPTEKSPDHPGAGWADGESFPVTSESSLHTHPNPERAMETVLRDLLAHKDYRRVRAAYCQLSIQLNLQKRVAPAFRPELAAGGGWGNEIHKLIHRDRVVIDYHWCHASGMQLLPTDAEHQSLFARSGPFDFAAAWALSGRKWRGTFRASERLCLTVFQQCQTLTLHGPELAACWKTLKSGWHASGGKRASLLSIARKQIMEWADRDARIEREAHAYLCLWIARELLGKGATNEQIGKLQALMLGTDAQDRATIRDKLKRLDKKVSIT